MKPVVVEQSPSTGWGLLRVIGKDRTRFLQGMLTNDIAALTVGAFCRACLLTTKGRVLAVVDVLCRQDDYLLITENADVVQNTLSRYAIADEVNFVVSDEAVHRLWNSPADVLTAPPVFGRYAGSPSPPDEVEVRRVEGGLPKYGVDISEEYFPFEANLQQTISATKGCYVGQEVVARARDRGHVNKFLMGLRLSGEGPITSGTALVVLTTHVGKITSSVVSPDFGPIALGYVHRSCAEPRTVVQAGDRNGEVCALPFG